MAGAEKPGRRPLMEAGMLKLRVVVSTLSSRDRGSPVAAGAMKYQSILSVYID
jgi:hypothetical protein